MCKTITNIKRAGTGEAKVQHFEESTSPRNSPIFSIKKKTEEWKILTDLTVINKAIRLLGPL